MKRVYFIGLITLALELWAYFIFRGQPLTRPEWYPTLLLAIQLVICLGGVYATRWLLRISPISRLESPRRDWTKLWLWCGPIGGLLLALACLLGKQATDQTGALLPGLVIVAHIAAGVVLWFIFLPWAASDLFSDPSAGFREKLLMQFGLVSHVIGLAVYIGFFPGGQVPPLSLLGAAFIFAFNLYYIMIVSITWSIVFLFWQPGALSPEEEKLNLRLESSDSYQKNR